MVVGLAALYAYQLREEWISALLGLWLAASPWLLGFSGNMGFTASDRARWCGGCPARRLDGVLAAGAHGMIVQHNRCR
ncbi:MAG: SPW repeat protein [Devosia sp.]|nr:SPW repeat protein [Devosia sp.]